MSDRPRRYETRDSRPPGRFPRWAKVLAVALAVSALIAAVVLHTLNGHSGGSIHHF